MDREYKTTRKVQEQGGSYLIVLPKMWMDSLTPEEREKMSVTFNGIVKISPIKEAKPNG